MLHKRNHPKFILLRRKNGKMLFSWYISWLAEAPLFAIA